MGQAAGSGRIVLFGATGFTGRLTAQALGRSGLPAGALVLAGRDRDRLAAVADDVAERTGRPPATSVADATNLEEVRDLLSPHDVLVSTVGPFLRVGTAAAQAAVAAGAVYLDSTGEPPFLLWMHRELSGRAEQTGARLLPAFGYDFVPGNLAGALALKAAGGEASRVEVGYFTTGGGSASGGTLASLAGVALRDGPLWRDGTLAAERPAARVRSFQASGRSRRAVSVGGSEHLALAHSFPALHDVDVFLGWGGRFSRLAQVGSGFAHAAARVPGTRLASRALEPLVRQVLPGSTGGPEPAAREAVRTLVVAEAMSPDRSVLARVTLDGPSPYDLTAELLAWGALGARAGRLRGTGLLGPVDAFGLRELVAGCAVLGLSRVPDSR